MKTAKVYISDGDIIILQKVLKRLDRPADTYLAQDLQGMIEDFIEELKDDELELC